MLKSLRPWATPLTIGTTLVTVVTGVLLFFHLAPGLTRLSHEWIGMLMVGAIVAHIVLNWRAFQTYFKRPIGLGIIVLGTVATIGSLAVPPSDAATAGSPVALVMQSMGQAELSVLADLAHRPVEDVLADLVAAGVPATPSTVLAQLSDGDRARQTELLRVILAR